MRYRAHLGGKMTEIDASNLKWFRRNEALHMLRRNVEIIQTGAVEGRGPLSESARIELGINAYELTKFCEQVERPLTAIHDVSGSGVVTVADLVKKFRNAISHSSTTEIKNYQSNVARMSMNIFVGQVANAIVINGNSFGCLYPDDVGINFGEYVILLVRHLLYVHNFAAAVVAEIPEDRRGEAIPRFTMPVLQELGV